MLESVREGNSGMDYVSNVWNLRALLLNVARAGLSSMGRWRTWAMPRWAALVRCAGESMGVQGWAEPFRSGPRKKGFCFSILVNY